MSVETLVSETRGGLLSRLRTDRLALTSSGTWRTRIFLLVSYMNASLLFLQAHSAEFWGVLVIRLRTRGIGTLQKSDTCRRRALRNRRSGG